MWRNSRLIFTLQKRYKKMTIKYTLVFLASSIFTFILHFFLADNVISEDVSILLYYIYIILFFWSCIHLFVISKVSKINTNIVIPIFLTLTILKMLISVVVVYFLNSYFTIETKIIIANFFIAYFFYLFLQVFFSVKFLNKPNFAEN